METQLLIVYLIIAIAALVAGRWIYRLLRRPGRHCCSCGCAARRGKQKSCR